MVRSPISCLCVILCDIVFFFFQAEDGIRDVAVTGVQTCALPISVARSEYGFWSAVRFVGGRGQFWCRPSGVGFRLGSSQPGDCRDAARRTSFGYGMGVLPRIFGLLRVAAGAI